MEFHFRAMGEELKAMYEYLDEVVSPELFGTASETVLRGVSRYEDVLTCRWTSKESRVWPDRPRRS